MAIPQAEFGIRLASRATRLLVAVFTLSTAWLARADGPPNIVWIMAEDIGCDLACYGTAAVRTPELDAMAARGVLYERAYCTSPICSPSRSAMMTGMYQTSIGAHHHRSHRQDGFQLPAPVRPITTYLQEAGYFCASGCGYGDKRDFNFNQPAGEPSLFNGRDWSERGPEQPFFAYIQLRVTHRGDWWQKTRAASPDPVDPDRVDLPPHLPDHPSIRLDWATYLDQVEAADKQVGEIFARLDQEGIAAETVVVFIGDNGRCFHRGKGFLYEEGVRVPCLLCWPGYLPADERDDSIISMIDLSAQVLAWAGVEVPTYMQGRPFLEPSSEPRQHAFAARDRWDEVRDKSRAVIGRKYKYIRNDMPEVPYFTYQEYLERVRPIRPVLWELFEAGEMTGPQAHVMRPRKPREELYDLRDDPLETVNLAGRPEHAERLRDFRGVLERWERETGDMGREPEPDESIGAEMLQKIAERDAVLRQSGEQ